MAGRIIGRCICRDSGCAIVADPVDLQRSVLSVIGRASRIGPGQ